MGLLLGESARFHPLWKGFIFCRLAKTFDSLNTMCWKESRAESTFLLSAFLPLRLGASLNVPCLVLGWTRCRNFPVSTFPTPIAAFPLQWHKHLQGPDSEALLFFPSSGKSSSDHLLHHLDRCSWMCYPLWSLGSSVVIPRTGRLGSSPRCPDRFGTQAVVLGACRVSGSGAEAVWGFHGRNIQIVVQLLSHVRLFVTRSPQRTAAHQASLSFTLPGFSQTYVHWVSDTIQPSHSLSLTSPPALNLSQQQGLFQWVGSSHQTAQAPISVSNSYLWIYSMPPFASLSIASLWKMLYERVMLGIKLPKKFYWQWSYLISKFHFPS